MEETEHLAIIKYFSKKGLTAKQIHEELKSTLGDSCPTLATVKKLTAQSKPTAATTTGNETPAEGETSTGKKTPTEVATTAAPSTAKPAPAAKTSKTPQIYQIKVTLIESQPEIWRRIEVPENYSFKDLHWAIQMAMGWGRYHHHFFQLPDLTDESKCVMVGLPDHGLTMGGEPPRVPEDQYKIRDYFKEENDRVYYEHDLGDSWGHEVLLERIAPATKGVKYPRCTGGKMACPPNDCGGIEGFKMLLEAIGDPNHEEHDSYKDWLKDEAGIKKYDPKKFNAKTIRFVDNA